MNTVTRTSGYAFAAGTAAALLAGAFIYAHAAAAAEPEFYTGTATLCAVDMTGVTTETRGNGGATYIYNQVLLFRIDTDNVLMHGWEVLTSNTLSTQGGGGYNWGEALLTPDGYEGAGTLVDDFKFPVRQADKIRGTYAGTGVLAGVTVDYALTPAEPFSGLPLDACDNMPWQDCVPEDPISCEPVPAGAAGYYMSGWVNPVE